MEKKMGNLHLSEALDIKQIITSDKNKFCIISGVGSGKNYLIEHVLPEYGNILYITSRRAKADEIIAEKICQEYVQWDMSKGDVTILTNFGVEQLVKNQKFNTGLKNISEHFNFLVIDEAHSVYTDATFTNSSFHVNTFIRHLSEKYPKIKIILMTGTPEPFPSDFLEDYIVIDKRSECINVVPKRIEIITKKTAMTLFEEIVKNKEKTIYYSNSATALVKGKRSLYQQLLENSILSSDDISFCMNESKAEKLEECFPKLVEHNIKTKECIAKTHCLPSTSKVLLTTSTLREGVNIEDKRIRVAFCESHLLSDIQQFAGRVRHGLDVLYIIDDASQHVIYDELLQVCGMEAHYDITYAIDAANQYLESYVFNQDSVLYSAIDYEKGYINLQRYFFKEDYSTYALGNTACRAFIDLIESRNNYIRYNHILSKFEIYSQRMAEQRRVNQLLVHEKWIDHVLVFANKHGIEYANRVPSLSDSLPKLQDALEAFKNVKLINQQKIELINILADAFQISTKAKSGTFNKHLSKNKIPFKLVNGHTTIDGKDVRYIMVTDID